MIPIKILWFPDEGLKRHIGRSFPRPYDEQCRYRSVLKPKNLPDPSAWLREEPYEMIELETWSLQSRLVSYMGASFWAWVHEEDGIWNIYF